MKGTSYEILFQGDSNTDVGRDRENPQNLGQGYPMFVKAMMDRIVPNHDIEFCNLGISGDRVKNLRERWTEDCLNHKPDVVSILVGINDV